MPVCTTCPCVWCVPVGLEVLQPGLQVVQQVDLLAALGAVDVHLLPGAQVTHLARSLARAVHKTHTRTNNEATVPSQTHNTNTQT